MRGSRSLDFVYILVHQRRCSERRFSDRGEACCYRYSRVVQALNLLGLGKIGSDEKNLYIGPSFSYCSGVSEPFNALEVALVSGVRINQNESI